MREYTKTLENLVLEIRLELYEYTEGNFFKDWLDRATSVLGEDNIKKFQYLKCGACDWFKNEDCSGFGWCAYSDIETKCDGSCKFFRSK